MEQLLRRSFLLLHFIKLVLVVEFIYSAAGFNLFHSEMLVADVRFELVALLDHQRVFH